MEHIIEVNWFIAIRCQVHSKEIEITISKMITDINETAKESLDLLVCSHLCKIGSKNKFGQDS